MFSKVYMRRAVGGLSAVLLSVLPTIAVAQPTQVAAGEAGSPGVSPRPDDPSTPPPSVTRRPGVKAPADEVDPELEGATDDTAGAVDDTAGAVDDTAGASDDTPPPPDPNAADASAAAEAAAKGFTGVRGTVVDAKTGEGLIEAQVQVVKGGKKATAITEVDGSFELELPPGEYELRVFTALYAGQRVKITVDAGTAEKVDVKLVPEEGSTEEVLVEAKIEKRTEAAQLQIRRRAVTVSDTISAQEISKTPDSSAGDAVKRVVSVTLIDGKYVALRGLEGRYVTTLLNGVVLPSPEPDRNAVPLDLFPTSLLSNLTVIKSYSAEFPGQFGGGTLLIETNSYPDDLEVKLSVGTSVSTTATGQEHLYQPSPGSSGFFGFDSGARALPSAVPTDRAVMGNASETESVGEAFRNEWSPEAETVWPNLTLGATVGNSNRFAGKRLGYLVSGSFRRGFTLREGVSRKTAVTDDGVTPTDDLRYQLGEQEATIGTLANVGFEIDRNNSIGLFGLYTHVGESTGLSSNGFSERENADIEVNRLQFVERALSFGQLTGFHRAPAAANLELRWQGNLATTARDELDSRDTTRVYDNVNQAYTFESQPGSGQRYFSFLDDLSYGGGADLTLPLSIFKLRAGATAQLTDRDFDGRRFRYRFVGDDPTVLQQPIEQMLGADNIGTAFRFQEDTLQEDVYEAGLDVYGGFGIAEAQLGSRLRAIGGLRFERSIQSLSNGTPLAVSGQVVDVERTDDDFLPTANLVYALTPQMNVRAAYSKTLVRPRFRELAPFLFFDYVRRRSISGNPNLLNTLIHNADLRWEWFTGDSGVFAVSGFYKRFQDPIEQVAANADQGDATFRNASSADLVGGEIEARTSLGILAPALRDLRVGANVAAMWSSVELAPGSELNTSQERPMYGQSPYVVNLNLEYANPKILDVNLLYNVIGKRITDVGVDRVPDTYEQPFHRLDIVASRRLGADLKLKLSVANLLSQDVELTQSNVVVSSYQPGVSFSLGLDWSPQ
jgi:outer membrane receptor protein involved in Fe transport